MQPGTTIARRYHGRVDVIGATASTLCAVHCALAPIIIKTLPLTVPGFLVDDATEWTLVGISVVLGVLGLSLGHGRHGARWPFGTLAAGFGLLALGRVVEEGELGTFGVVMTVVGGLSIAGSHLVNRRLCLSCEPCRTNDDLRLLSEVGLGVKSSHVGDQS